jgi:hypothetical protein
MAEDRVQVIRKVWDRDSGHFVATGEVFECDESLEQTVFEPTKLESQRMARTVKSQRFVRVWEAWMADRWGNRLFSARARLFLFLVMESYEGKKPVRMTNAMAAKLGLPRQNKLRELRWLQAAGLVVVTSEGNKTPVVTLTDSAMPKRSR